MKLNLKSLCLSATLLFCLALQAQAEQTEISLQTAAKLWLSDGALTANGQQLIALLNDPTLLGLPKASAPALPAEEHLSNNTLEQHFVDLTSKLSQGSMRPDRSNEWHIPQDAYSISLLRERIRSGEPLMAVLESLLPESSEYSSLVSAFHHYQSIQSNGGWPLLADTGEILRPGERHEEVPVLRNRLRVEGDFAASMQADPFFFSQALANAVRQYQKRHGLLADGILDHQTRSSLRIPVSERVQQIQVNLERWRWMPRSMAKRRLWVNTAGAFAQLIDQDEVQLQFRAIAGRPYRATPSLFSSIDRLVVNPAWGVPHRIAVEDLLPLQKKNKHFFAQKNIRVFRHRNGQSVEVNRSSIDWSTVTASDFPYQLRQDPGEHNSMGRIKFVFANEFNVYLHDTPNKVLFELPNRNFSSGCVRLENPFELANAVLADTQHKLEQLQELSSPGNTRSQSLTLDQPLPIYLVYMTNWFDDNGLLHFSKDRYGRDQLVAEGLKKQRAAQIAAVQSHAYSP